MPFYFSTSTINNYTCTVLKTMVKWKQQVEFNGVVEKLNMNSNRVSASKFKFNCSKELFGKIGREIQYYGSN